MLIKGNDTHTPNIVIQMQVNVNKVTQRKDIKQLVTQ